MDCVNHSPDSTTSAMPLYEGSLDNLRGFGYKASVDYQPVCAGS
jgi:hypothetical protein